MRAKNFTHHSTASNKNCKGSLVIVIYQANIYYSDQNLFEKKDL